jgi:cell fate (sporulation/competence/biofilm development) regulator YlbF (YheA/YmcA/DUF963 family)
MLDKELHEATLEFARSLGQAPAVSAYRAATAALEADGGAQALLKDLRTQQETLVRLQQSGLSPTQLQIDALRRCQAIVRTNATIMAQLRARNDVKAFLPLVARYITSALGADYAQLVAPQSC